GNLRRTSLPWSYVFGSASRGLQGGLCDSTTHRCFVRPLVFNLLSRLCADFLSRERSPPFSNQGVEVGITGVRCYVNRTADPMTETTIDDELGLEVKLAINNSSDQIAEVSEGQFRL